MELSSDIEDDDELDEIDRNVDQRELVMKLEARRGVNHVLPESL